MLFNCLDREVISSKWLLRLVSEAIAKNFSGLGEGRIDAVLGFLLAESVEGFSLSRFFGKCINKGCLSSGVGDSFDEMLLDLLVFEYSCWSEAVGGGDSN